MAKGSSRYVENNYALTKKQVVSTSCEDSNVLAFEKPLIIWFSIFILSLFAPWVDASDRAYTFDIQQQRADGALTALANQADISVVFDFDVVSQHQTQQLKGRYTIRKAVGLLLAGTPLKYEFNNSGHLIITKVEELAGERQMEIRRKKNFLSAVIGLLVGAGGASNLFAQDSDGESPELALEEIHVYATYRSSLEAALDLKRDTTSFVDSISAEDMGKFPDNNLAESLQRISGVQISRTNGEGQRISLRGMSPKFSKTVLNGLPISISSEGSIDQGANDRGVDFDIFPSEMFTSLEVYKSPVASIVSGGISGTVNLRTARPFDYDGLQGSYSIEETYSEAADKVNPSGSFLVSNTWNDKFGALFAAAVSKRKFHTEGFETFDWARGRVSDDIDPIVGGTDFDWNLTDGNQSGVSDQQLANAKVPRLARPSLVTGDRDRTGLYTAFQWMPTEDVNLNLDVTYSKLEEDFKRYTNNMLVRGTSSGRVDQYGWITPRDVVMDGRDTVTSMTLDGVRFWSENRAYTTETDFVQVNFSGDWQINDLVRMDWAIAKSESDWSRRQTSFLYLSDPSVTSYQLKGKTVVINPGFDIEDSNNWVFDTLRVQPRSRTEENEVSRFDFTFGDDANNIRTGVMVHNYERDRKDINWTNTDEILEFSGYAAGSARSIDLQGLATTLSKDHGDTFENRPGYSNWVVADFDGLAAAGFDLDAMDRHAGTVGLSRGGSFTVIEDTVALYIEANLTGDIAGREVRLNAGVRMVDVDVEGVGYYDDLDGNRQRNSVDGEYTHYLPSFTVSADVTDNLLFRFSGSRTMTKPDPGRLNPDTSISDDGYVNQGNPNLDPFFTDNVDLGLEWYFAEESVVAVNYFYKNLTGFTITEFTEQPFGNAGIPIAEIQPDKLLALPDGITLDTVVDFKTKVNSDEELQVSGFEFLYQQPLDMVLPGLGVLANFTKVHVSSEDGDGLEGLSDQSYNLVGYYERENYSVRLSYNVRSNYPDCTSDCRNGQPDGRIVDDSGYLDLATSYRLEVLEQEIELSLQVNNLTEEVEYVYFGDEGRVQSLQSPGRQYRFGIKGKF
jgi:TonB-dependent receptor